MARFVFVSFLLRSCLMVGEGGAYSRIISHWTATNKKRSIPKGPKHKNEKHDVGIQPLFVISFLILCFGGPRDRFSKYFEVHMKLRSYSGTKINRKLSSVSNSSMKDLKYSRSSSPSGKNWSKSKVTLVIGKKKPLTIANSTNMPMMWVLYLKNIYSNNKCE